MSAPEAPAAVPGALRFDGTWSFAEDANHDSPAPSLQLGATSPTSVTVSYDGTDGMKCGCNSEHQVVHLAKAYDCATTTLEFDYAASGSFGYTSSQSISVRFCKDGTCADDANGFYGGDAYVASEQVGHSNCAWQWQNQFPASPQLTSGHNVVELGKLTKETNGTCTGTFDTIDVHVQAYACFATRDSGSQTLSNIVLR